MKNKKENAVTLIQDIVSLPTEKMAADNSIPQKHVKSPNAKTKYIHSDIKRNANMATHADFKLNACTNTQKKSQAIQ